MKISAATFKGTIFRIEANRDDAGIPEQADIPPVVRTTAAPPTDIPGQAAEATAAPASGLTTGVTDGPTGGPNASPFDLFPQFQALRNMVQGFFQSLEPMFEELWNQNPQLMLLIQDHKSEYLRLINLLVERGEEEGTYYLS